LQQRRISSNIVYFGKERVDLRSPANAEVATHKVSEEEAVAKVAEEAAAKAEAEAAVKAEAEVAGAKAEAIKRAHRKCKREKKRLKKYAKAAKAKEEAARAKEAAAKRKAAVASSKKAKRKAENSSKKARRKEAKRKAAKKAAKERKLREIDSYFAVGDFFDNVAVQWKAAAAAKAEAEDSLFAVGDFFDNVAVQWKAAKAEAEAKAAKATEEASAKESEAEREAARRDIEIRKKMRARRRRKRAKVGKKRIQRKNSIVPTKADQLREKFRTKLANVRQQRRQQSTVFLKGDNENNSKVATIHHVPGKRNSCLAEAVLKTLPKTAKRKMLQTLKGKYNVDKDIKNLNPYTLKRILRKELVPGTKLYIALLQHFTPETLDEVQTRVERNEWAQEAEADIIGLLLCVKIKAYMQNIQEHEKMHYKIIGDLSANLQCHIYNHSVKDAHGVIRPNHFSALTIVKSYNYGRTFINDTVETSCTPIGGGIVPRRQSYVDNRLVQVHQFSGELLVVGVNNRVDDQSQFFCECEDAGEEAMVRRALDGEGRRCPTNVTGGHIDPPILELSIEPDHPGRFLTLPFVGGNNASETIPRFIRMDEIIEMMLEEDRQLHVTPIYGGAYKKTTTLTETLRVSARDIFLTKKIFAKEACVLKSNTHARNLCMVQELAEAAGTTTLMATLHRVDTNVKMNVCGGMEACDNMLPKIKRLNQTDWIHESSDNEDERNGIAKENEMTPIHGGAKNYTEFTPFQKLYEGTFGKILIGTNADTKENMIAKMYHGAIINSDERQSMVRNEINILHATDHQNIVRFYGYKYSKYEIYIFLEYCNGGDMFEHVKTNGRIVENVAYNLLDQLLNGLKYLHNKNIVHLDIKPENVLIHHKLCGDRIVKFADFDTSRFIEDGELVTCTHGTADYAPPEVLFTGNAVDGKLVDIWGIGVVFFFMITGKSPFRCDSFESDRMIYKRISKGEYAMPNNVPPFAERLISNILVVDPLKRITIDDIKRDLQIPFDMQVGITMTEENALVDFLMENHLCDVAVGNEVIEGKEAAGIHVRVCATQLFGGMIVSIEDQQLRGCEDAGEEAMLRRALDGEKRRCPACRVYVVRRNGCDHITCINCGTHFCYVCGTHFCYVCGTRPFRRSMCNHVNVQPQQRQPLAQQSTVEGRLDDEANAFTIRATHLCGGMMHTCGCNGRKRLQPSGVTAIAKTGTEAPERKECRICLEKFEKGFDVKDTCDHGIICCPPCFKKHAETTLMDNKKFVKQNKFHIKCPVNGCQTMHSMKDILSSCPDLGRKFKKKLHKLKKTKKQISLPSKMNRKMNQKMKVHESKKLNSGFVDLPSGMGKARVCPGQCGHTMKRSEGCDHMTCPNCFYEFCFICGIETSDSHHSMHWKGSNKKFRKEQYKMKQKRKKNDRRETLLVGGMAIAMVEEDAGETDVSGAKTPPPTRPTPIFYCNYSRGVDSTELTKQLEEELTKRNVDTTHLIGGMERDIAYDENWDEIETVVLNNTIAKKHELIDLCVSSSRQGRLNRQRNLINKAKKEEKALKSSFENTKRKPRKKSSGSQKGLKKQNNIKKAAPVVKMQSVVMTKKSQPTFNIAKKVDTASEVRLPSMINEAFENYLKRCLVKLPCNFGNKNKVYFLAYAMKVEGVEWFVDTENGNATWDCEWATITKILAGNVINPYIFVIKYIKSDVLPSFGWHGDPTSTMQETLLEILRNNDTEYNDNIHIKMTCGVNDESGNDGSDQNHNDSVDTMLFGGMDFETAEDQGVGLKKINGEEAIDCNANLKQGNKAMGGNAEVEMPQPPNISEGMNNLNLLSTPEEDIGCNAQLKEGNSDWDEWENIETPPLIKLTSTTNKNTCCEEKSIPVKIEGEWTNSPRMIRIEVDDGIKNVCLKEISLYYNVISFLDIPSMVNLYKTGLMTQLSVEGGRCHDPVKPKGMIAYPFQADKRYFNTFKNLYFKRKRFVELLVTYGYGIGGMEGSFIGVCRDGDMNKVELFVYLHSCHTYFNINNYEYQGMSIHEMVNTSYRDMYYSETALSEAVIVGNVEIVDLLLKKYNADPTMVDIYGSNAIKHAICSNSLTITKLLLKEASVRKNINYADDDNCTALDYCYRSEDINTRFQMINLIQDAGGKRGHTVLEMLDVNPIDNHEFDFEIEQIEDFFDEDIGNDDIMELPPAIFFFK